MEHSVFEKQHDFFKITSYFKHWVFHGQNIFHKIMEINVKFTLNLRSLNTSVGGTRTPLNLDYRGAEVRTFLYFFVSKWRVRVPPIYLLIEFFKIEKVNLYC